MFQRILYPKCISFGVQSVLWWFYFILVSLFHIVNSLACALLSFMIEMDIFYVNWWTNRDSQQWTTTVMNITWNALIFMANQFQKTKVYRNGRVVCSCVCYRSSYYLHRLHGAVVCYCTVHFDHCMQNYCRHHCRHHCHPHHKPPPNQLKTNQTRSRRKRGKNGHRDFIAICYNFTTPLL